MAITEYKVIKAHLESIEQAMAAAIDAGFQPVGQPVMQYPAEKTVMQVVAKGAPSTITDYRVIKAPIESISSIMASAIADGYQPFERPIMLYPDDKTMLQAVTKGSQDGGGEQVTIVVADISDATDTGKALLLADDEEAARAAIGAGTGNSNLALGTTASTAKAGNYQPTWAQVQDKPAVIGAGATQEAARQAIGAISAEDIPEVPAAPTWDTLGSKPAVIAAGATEEAARQAIGAISAEDVPSAPAAPTWDTLAEKPAFIAAGDTEAAARQAIGAGTSSLALGTGATQASAGNHNHAVTADAGSGLAAAANIQALAVALSTRIKALEDAVVE